MKTALKVLFFSCLTVLLLFVLEKNKQIRQYKTQEQHNLHVLDTLQLELNGIYIDMYGRYHTLPPKGISIMNKKTYIRFN